MDTATSGAAPRQPPRPPPPGRHDAPAAPAAAAAPRLAATAPLRLLVVDDDLATIEYLGQLLKDIAQVSFATNGEDALRLASLRRPDLVMLDIALPGLDGFEVCRRLRTTPGLQGVPVVFASQHLDAETEDRAWQLGAQAFLRKPLDDAQVLAQLRTAPAPTAAALPFSRRRGDGPPDAAAHRATASMLSYIAHELGNPVNVIRGFAQLMQADRRAPLPAAQAEKLAHILDAVERLSGLLADVSDVARMESGQFLVEPEAVDLHTLVQQAGGAAWAEAATAGVQLHLPQPGAPLAVQADARRLRQCLDNLLSNAIKYGGDGGRVDVHVRRHDGDIVLAVQDHGAGLSPVQQAHLFEPYNRLGRDGGAIPGTGLGLTLTRELMQAMGGRLQAHSDGPGRGCRFELVLKPAPG